mgnify:FL=1
MKKVERTTDILRTVRMMIKLYDKMLRSICDRYQLTQIEADIISFLKNNPGKDTVGDIAELRMLSKGNVSRGAEELIQRGLLRREQDPQDRRRMHLTLLPAADPIVSEIQQVRGRFLQKMFDGFGPEELEAYACFNKRIVANIKTALERGEQHE